MPSGWDVDTDAVERHNAMSEFQSAFANRDVGERVALCAGEPFDA